MIFIQMMKFMTDNLIFDAFTRITSPAVYVCEAMQHARINAVDSNKIKYDLENGFAIIDGKDDYNIHLVNHDNISKSELVMCNAIHDNLIIENKGSKLKHSLRYINSNHKINSKIIVVYFAQTESNKEYVSIRWKEYKDDSIRYASEFVKIYSDCSVKSCEVRNMHGCVSTPKELREFVKLFQTVMINYFI